MGFGILLGAAGCDPSPGRAPTAEDASPDAVDASPDAVTDGRPAADMPRAEPDAQGPPPPDCPAFEVEASVECQVWCPEYAYQAGRRWTLGDRPQDQGTWSLTQTATCLWPMPLPNAPGWIGFSLHSSEAPRLMTPGEVMDLIGTQVFLMQSPEVEFSLPTRSAVAHGRWAASEYPGHFQASGAVLRAELSLGDDSCVHVQLAGQLELVDPMGEGWTAEESAPMDFEIRLRMAP